jgi:benzoyl-CoA reductase/2-hydroxyglutaryl-CoA dehydratase subunit BcrC/BadD/HgdB
MSCDSSFDCFSSEGSIFAKCGCSHGSSENICGILQGNEEWQAYFKAVKSYYSSTKDCHGARNFEGTCTQDGLNNEKQCKKAMAKNYIEYTNAPE